MMNKEERDTALDWCAHIVRQKVAIEFGVSEDELMSPTRARSEVAFARQVAMYLTHVVYQLTYHQVAEAFGRERTTVAYACAVVEDARDDVVLDTRLERLEATLVHLHKLREGQRIDRCGRLATLLDMAS